LCICKTNGSSNNFPCYPPYSHQSHNAVYWRTGGHVSKHNTEYYLYVTSKKWVMFVYLIIKVVIFSAQNEPSAAYQFNTGFRGIRPRQDTKNFPGLLSRTISLLFHKLLQQKVIAIMVIRGSAESSPSGSRTQMYIKASLHPRNHILWWLFVCHNFFPEVSQNSRVFQVQRIHWVFQVNGLWGEGLVRLTRAVACLLAANHGHGQWMAT